MREVEENPLAFRLLGLLLLFSCAPFAQSLLAARGPRSVVLNVDAVKGTGNAANSNGRLELWCTAVDQQTNRMVPIKRATFRFGTQGRHEAKLSANSFNASLVRENSPAIETGTWRCDLQTDRGNATGNIVVYVRPVVYSNNTGLRVDEKDGSHSSYSVTGLTAVRGTKVVLQCPVVAHPKPDIIWKHNDQVKGSGRDAHP
ncbi:Ig-like domain-containing protein [Aphelenchoides fujianensis]|nr:Ig-like domain-containing protein [Aphelenchoides fujianensis]